MYHWANAPMDDRNPLSYTCATCGASRGRRCVAYMTSGYEMNWVHTARKKAAEDAAVRAAEGKRS